MKNKRKRVLGILAAMAFLVAMAPTVLTAAPTSPPDTGITASLTIHPIAIGDPTDLEPATGAPNTGITNKPGVVPLEGSTITVYPVTTAEGTLGSSDPADYTKGTPLGTYALDGKPVSIPNIPFGTYLVEDDAATARFESFVIRVPMVDPLDDSAWLYDVFVYPKSTRKPHVDKNLLNTAGTGTANGDKAVAGTPPEKGTVLHWEIEVEIPGDIEDAAHYVVTDNLDPWMQLLPSSIKVFARDTGGQLMTIPASAYDTSQTSIGLLHLDFTKTATGKDNLAAALAGAGTQRAMLYVQFSANVRIDIQEVGIVPNRAALGYTNMEGLVNNGLSQPGNTPGQGGNAEVYAISMTKLESDGSTQNPLAGAKFKIYPSEADAIDGTNAIQNPAGGGDWEVESNAQGVFEFSGLVGGDYWLVETVVPSGMAAPQGPIKIELNKDNTDQVTGYVYRANIVNFPEFELPATGARTALIFTVAGLVLIAGGTLFLILRRRHMNN